MFVDFVDGAIARVTGLTVRDARRSAFEAVSMRDYMIRLHEGAQALHPNVPIREGLRRMGYSLYDDFERTMIGKAIFSVAGKEITKLASLAQKAYSVSYSPGSLTARITGERRIAIIMSPILVYPDTFQVGAWEGAARFCGKEAMVLIRTPIREPGYVELELTF